MKSVANLAERFRPTWLQRSRALDPQEFAFDCSTGDRIDGPTRIQADAIVLRRGPWCIEGPPGQPRVQIDPPSTFAAARLLDLSMLDRPLDPNVLSQWFAVTTDRVVHERAVRVGLTVVAIAPSRRSPAGDLGKRRVPVDVIESSCRIDSQPVLLIAEGDRLLEITAGEGGVVPAQRHPSAQPHRSAQRHRSALGRIRFAGSCRGVLVVGSERGVEELADGISRRWVVPSNSGRGFGVHGIEPLGPHWIATHRTLGTFLARSGEARLERLPDPRFRGDADTRGIATLDDGRVLVARRSSLFTIDHDLRVEKECDAGSSIRCLASRGHEVALGTRDGRVIVWDCERSALRFERAGLGPVIAIQPAGPIQHDQAQSSDDAWWAVDGSPYVHEMTSDRSSRRFSGLEGIVGLTRVGSIAVTLDRHRCEISIHGPRGLTPIRLRQPTPFVSSRIADTRDEERSST